MKRLIVLLLLLYPLGAEMDGQGRRQPRGGTHPFVFFEAVNMVPFDSSLSRIEIQYRIDLGFFVPVRNQDGDVAATYRRTGEILVEVIDSTGTTRGRELHQVEQDDDASERPPDQRRWYQGAFTFEVPPGTYSLLFDVGDKESTRRFTDKSKRVHAASFRKGDPVSSTPLFLSDTLHSVSERALTLQNFGGNIRFGSPGSVLLEIPTPDTPVEKADVKYAITVTRDEEPDGDPMFGGMLTDVPVRSGYTLHHREDPASLTYDMMADQSRSTVWLVIPIPAQKLPLRMFTLDLEVRLGDDPIEVRKLFRTIWPEMPQSLRDVNFALQALRYITTEDELDSLMSGDFEARRDNLEGFWKPKDQTPETAYNEVMTQYYRRVDHTLRSFGTIRRPDGFRTDRGRIYVLYGPPTTTERKLDPDDGFQEIWIYDRLGKKFIFADPSKSGDYELVSTSTP
jgi:GWxTD domain-containing protein